MIWFNDCDRCKHKLPMKDGWLPCCEAFPNGRPKDFDYDSIEENKECNNGIGFEPKEEPAQK